MKYKDNSKTHEHLENIKKLPTLGEIYNYVNSVFPTWMIGFYDNYCPNYTYFNQNWENICKQNNTTKKQILIVDDMIFDDNHTFIRTISEIFTRLGFCVRSKQEFILCEKCYKSVLPCKTLYDVIKIKEDLTIPNNWSNICANCI